MPKKIIALDIDDVLSQNIRHFVEWSNEAWGTNMTEDEFNEDFTEMWGVSRDVAQQRFQQYVDNELAKDHVAIGESVPVIKRLKQTYDFILVTSRRTVLAPITRKWVNENFPDLFETIHHTGFFDDSKNTHSHHMTKADICRDIGADYLIDDQPKHCFAVAEAGIQTLLFGEYKWNREVIELPPRVVKVKDWTEVEGYFNGRD